MNTPPPPPRLDSPIPSYAYTCNAFFITACTQAANCPLSFNGPTFNMKTKQLLKVS